MGPMSSDPSPDEPAAAVPAAGQQGAARPARRGPADTAAGPETRLSRRAAVRRSAAVLAGTAGLLALPGLTQTAAADPGDALRLGNRNRSADAQTRLQSSTTVATLSLLNERASDTEQFSDVELVSAQLRLESSIPGAVRPQVPDVRSVAAGDLVAGGGLLYFGAEAGGFNVVASQVFTSFFANYLHPVPPSQATVLDTRADPSSASGPSPADLDGAGRLVGGRRIAVDLRGLVDTTYVPTSAAVALSVHVFDAVQSGAVLMFPDERSEVGARLLSYAVLPGSVTASGTPYPVPGSAGALVGLDTEDRLWLQLTATAHLLVQVTGLFVPDPTVVVEPPEMPADGSAAARRVRRQRDALRRLTAGSPLPK